MSDSLLACLRRLLTLCASDAGAAAMADASNAGGADGKAAAALTELKMLGELQRVSAASPNAALTVNAVNAPVDATVASTVAGLEANGVLPQLADLAASPLRLAQLNAFVGLAARQARLVTLSSLVSGGGSMSLRLPDVAEAISLDRIRPILAVSLDAPQAAAFGALSATAMDLSSARTLFGLPKGHATALPAARLDALGALAAGLPALIAAGSPLQKVAPALIPLSALLRVATRDLNIDLRVPGALDSRLSALLAAPALPSAPATSGLAELAAAIPDVQQTSALWTAIDLTWRELHVDLLKPDWPEGLALAAPRIGALRAQGLSLQQQLMFGPRLQPQPQSQSQSQSLPNLDALGAITGALTSVKAIGRSLGTGLVEANAGSVLAQMLKRLLPADAASTPAAQSEQSAQSAASTQSALPAQSTQSTQSAQSSQSAQTDEAPENPALLMLPALLAQIGAAAARRRA